MSPPVYDYDVDADELGERVADALTAEEFMSLYAREQRARSMALLLFGSVVTAVREKYGVPLGTPVTVPPGWTPGA